MPHFCAHWWRLSGNSSALWEGSSDTAAHLGLMRADANCQAHTFLCGNTTALYPRTWAPSSPFVRLSTNCCGSSLSRPSCHSSCHMRYPLSHSGSYGATTCSVAGRLHGGAGQHNGTAVPLDMTCCPKGCARTARRRTCSSHTVDSSLGHQRHVLLPLMSRVSATKALGGQSPAAAPAHNQLRCSVGRCWSGQGLDQLGQAEQKLLMSASVQRWSERLCLSSSPMLSH